METPSFQCGVKTWKPAVFVGGRDMETPSFPGSGAALRRVPRNGNPSFPSVFPSGAREDAETPSSAGLGWFYAVPRHGNLGFPCHRPQVPQTGDPSRSGGMETPNFPPPSKKCIFEDANKRNDVRMKRTEGAMGIVVRILSKVTRAKLRIEATKG